MQCLYCGKRLSLLRKLKDSEFCSEQHRDLYQQEQTALALKRLTEAGNRLSQQRATVESPPRVEDTIVDASPQEELHPPEASGFLREPPGPFAPPCFQTQNAIAGWLTVTALPALLTPPLRTDWQLSSYRQPAVPAARTGVERSSLSAAVSQADFKPEACRPPVLALGLDLSSPESIESGESAFSVVAPKVPVPPPLAARPPESVLQSMDAVNFKWPPPAVEPHLTLPLLKPAFAGEVSPQPRAAAPHASWWMPQAWPAMPRVNIRTLVDGPFERAGAIDILADPRWKVQVPPLAHALPYSFRALSSSLRAREPEAEVNATPQRLLPAGARLDNAGFALAPGRMPAPCAVPASPVMFGKGVGFAAPSQTPVGIPAFPVRTTARITASGGRVGIPIKTFKLTVDEARMAGEIPIEAQRRLPEFDWRFAELQFSPEGGWESCAPAVILLPPRAVAGSDRVTPLASRARGGRKVAAKVALPGPCPSIGEAHLGSASCLVPLASPPTPAGPDLAGCAPGPEVRTLIPCRRRTELQALVALPCWAELTPCQGMAASRKLARIEAGTRVVEDPRMAAHGVARVMDWTSFPPPAMPSAEAIRGSLPLHITAPSIGAQTKLFSIQPGGPAKLTSSTAHDGVVPPHTICRPPWLPSLETPQDSRLAHERTSALLNAILARVEGGTQRWALGRFWRRTPVTLKGLVAGVLLLGAVFAMGDGSTSQWMSSLREDIRSRAAVDLVDDFRAGMGAWSGGENWAETWSYDSAGLVQTGDLALYRPSMALSNYRFEFLGQIGDRGIGWVFRAVDTENYYAMKIVFAGSGPMPAATVVRYAVIDGKAGPKTQLPLPMGARPDRMYRVRVDVDGSNFTAQFQDQIIDVWSDKRLAAGGVGFFSEKGEKAKIRWIEVSHQSDFLGKLCAYLVPFDARSANRSLTQ